MKKLILVLLLCVSVFGYNHNRAYRRIMHLKPNYPVINRIVKNLDQIGNSKKNIMRLVYSVGKLYNLQNTLLAIVYKESHLGDYMFNTLTGDYGLAGINLRTFKRLHHIKLDYWGDKKLASMLICSNRMNLAAAVNNLLGWRKIYKYNYNAIWGSYNGGFKPSFKYAESILNINIAFRLYFKSHPTMAIYVKGK